MCCVDSLGVLDAFLLWEGKEGFGLPKISKNSETGGFRQIMIRSSGTYIIIIELDFPVFVFLPQVLHAKFLKISATSGIYLRISWFQVIDKHCQETIH